MAAAAGEAGGRQGLAPGLLVLSRPRFPRSGSSPALDPSRGQGLGLRRCLEAEKCQPLPGRWPHGHSRDRAGHWGPALSRRRVEGLPPQQEASTSPSLSASRVDTWFLCTRVAGQAVPRGRADRMVPWPPTWQTWCRWTRGPPVQVTEKFTTVTASSQPRLCVQADPSPTMDHGAPTEARQGTVEDRAAEVPPPSTRALSSPGLWPHGDSGPPCLPGWTLLMAARPPPAGR